MKGNRFFSRLLEDWVPKIVCLALAVTLSVLYRESLLDSRYIMVPLKVESNGQLIPAEQSPRKIKVLLWGDAATIASINDDDVTAFIDISHYKSPDTYRIPIQTRLNGAISDFGTIETGADPKSISLRLEQRVTKQVPVILSLKGIPADGYEVSESSIEPATAELYGPAALIEKINTLTTEPLVIEARTTGFSGTASIVNTEPLIGMLSSEHVQYTVKIQEAMTGKSFPAVPLYFEKLPVHFKIVSEQKTGSIVLYGPKKALEGLTMPENALTVSCEAIKEPGIYTLPVIPAVTAGTSKIKVTQFTPKTVNVKIETAEEPRKEER